MVGGGWRSRCGRRPVRGTQRNVPAGGSANAKRNDGRERGWLGLGRSPEGLQRHPAALRREGSARRATMFNPARGERCHATHLL